MSARFRQLTITSCEQAEGLPQGTVIIDQPCHYMYLRYVAGWEAGLELDLADGVRPTALVPVEPEDDAAALLRVLELHAPDEHGWCPECSRGRLYAVPAPCSTALAGGEA